MPKKNRSDDHSDTSPTSKVATSCEWGLMKQDICAMFFLRILNWWDPRQIYQRNHYRHHSWFPPNEKYHPKRRTCDFLGFFWRQFHGSWVHQSSVILRWPFELPAFVAYFTKILIERLAWRIICREKPAHRNSFVLAVACLIEDPSWCHSGKILKSPWFQFFTFSNNTLRSSRVSDFNLSSPVPGCNGRILCPTCWVKAYDLNFQKRGIRGSTRTQTRSIRFWKSPTKAKLDWPEDILPWKAWQHMKSRDMKEYVRVCQYTNCVHQSVSQGTSFTWASSDNGWCDSNRQKKGCRIQGYAPKNGFLASGRTAKVCPHVCTDRSIQDLNNVCGGSNSNRKKWGLPPWW